MYIFSMFPECVSHVWCETQIHDVWGWNWLNSSIKGTFLWFIYTSLSAKALYSPIFWKILRSWVHLCDFLSLWCSTAQHTQTHICTFSTKAGMSLKCFNNWVLILWNSLIVSIFHLSVFFTHLCSSCSPLTPPSLSPLDKRQRQVCLNPLLHFNCQTLGLLPGQTKVCVWMEVLFIIDVLVIILHLRFDSRSPIDLWET